MYRRGHESVSEFLFLVYCDEEDRIYGESIENWGIRRIRVRSFKLVVDQDLFVRRQYPTSVGFLEQVSRRYSAAVSTFTVYHAGTRRISQMESIGVSSSRSRRRWRKSVGRVWNAKHVPSSAPRINGEAGVGRCGIGREEGEGI